MCFPFSRNSSKVNDRVSPVAPQAPAMDEGDFHSGPHGYSPNTPYQETQYGSRFDEEADWNEEA